MISKNRQQMLNYLQGSSGMEELKNGTERADKLCLLFLDGCIINQQLVIKP
jgi:hypothetical protein